MASSSKHVEVQNMNRSPKKQNSKTTTAKYHLFESSSGVQWIKNKLIVTYIPPNMEKEDILPMFQAIGEVVEFKLIKKKETLENLGFGFVTYTKDEDAQEAIRRIDGIRVFNKNLKVCFARPKSNDIKGTNLYVSGFSKSMTKDQFENIFKSFGTVITSRILFDNTTIRQFIKDGENLSGISKGVGFIRYNTKQETETAINNLNGVYLEDCTEPLLVKYAKNSSSTLGSQEYRHSWRTQKTDHFNTLRDYYYLHENPNSSFGTVGYCIFIYNLPESVDEKFMWNMFARFGTINRVKIPKNHETGKNLGYGFVNFMYYESAVTAIRQLNGYHLRGHILQVRFKKNS